MKKILVVDDDVSLARTLELYFQSKDYSVWVAHHAARALELWEANEPDLVLLDVQLPDRDGPDVLAQAKRDGLAGNVIMITAFQDTQATLEALQQGATDYLYKPLDLDALDLLLEKILQQQSDRRKLGRLSHVISEYYRPKQIIGRSSAILDVIKAIAHVAPTRTTVLLEGETGTGKELVAQTIHDRSTPNEPFMGINCAAIVGNLLESELFGHEKGAFTGAVQRKVGKLEFADEGTIFLDEITELPLELQAKLLRVLESKEFQRVGGVENRPLKARIIAATNRNLKETVQQGNFRQDLFFRLQVFVIKLPPLRERREDIILLTDYFLTQLNHELHKKVLRIPQQATAALEAYDWPGNVRELNNVLRRAMILSRGELLELDQHWLARKPADSDVPSTEDLVPQSLAEIEKHHIAGVLDFTAGNYGKACEILGITRPTLRKKIQDYNLEPDR